LGDPAIESLLLVFCAQQTDVVYIVTVSYVLMIFLMFISSEKLHNISDEMNNQIIKNIRKA